MKGGRDDPFVVVGDAGSGDEDDYDDDNDEQALISDEGEDEEILNGDEGEYASDDEVMEATNAGAAAAAAAGEEGWRNREGERLADFGVDEVADFYDEADEDEDVPLGQLLARRKGAS